MNCQVSQSARQHNPNACVRCVEWCSLALALALALAPYNSGSSGVSARVCVLSLSNLIPLLQIFCFSLASSALFSSCFFSRSRLPVPVLLCVAFFRVCVMCVFCVFAGTPQAQAYILHCVCTSSPVPCHCHCHCHCPRVRFGSCVSLRVVTYPFLFGVLLYHFLCLSLPCGGFV